MPVAPTIAIRGVRGGVYDMLSSRAAKRSIDSGSCCVQDQQHNDCGNRVASPELLVRACTGPLVEGRELAGANAGTLGTRCSLTFSLGAANERIIQL